MALAVLTFQDEDDGRVNIQATFEPPINTREGGSNAPATVAAFNALQAAADGGEDVEVSA